MPIDMNNYDEDKSIIQRVNTVKKKYNYRQFFIVAILLFATAADILIDYVNAGFDPAIFAYVSYWITLALTCLSVVLVTISVRDFFKEKELRENPQLKEVLKNIDNAHAELVRRNLTTKFAEYVTEINTERKKQAYISYINFKYTKARTKRGQAKWKKLINNAQNQIEYIPTKGNVIKLSPVHRIKFNRVKVATVFGGVERARSDDDNLETDEGKQVSELIFKKLFSVVAFSIALSTLFFEPNEFAVAVLINTFSKLFRTAMSVYLGATDGQAFVRSTLLTKLKLRYDFIQKFLEREAQASTTTPVIESNN